MSDHRCRVQENLVLVKALGYGSRGKPVFPCGPDKSPLTGHGFKDATTDPAQIESWWDEHPDALIGMPTGEITGFTVLDVDVDPGKDLDGTDALHELERANGKLPHTAEALTPRGGRHIFFNYVPGVRNSAGKLGPGLDVRGDGGYVIIPPSGVNGHAYHWEASNPETFADMPDWMVTLLKQGEAPHWGCRRQDTGGAPQRTPDLPSRFYASPRHVNASDRGGTAGRKREPLQSSAG